MNVNIWKYICTVALCIFCNSLYAEWDCTTFSDLPKESQKQFLRGYTYGAAMEMKTLNSNYITNKLDKTDIHVENYNELTKRLINTRLYVKKRYIEMNIAYVYQDDFHQYVNDACSKSPGSDLFIVLPQVLQMMKKTGNYPVHGM